MGTWGAGLYASDCTCDVKDTYMECLQEQLSNEEAYEKTIEVHDEYIGDEDEPLLWYALADTQWRLGHLMPEVKKKALDWVDQVGGIENWKESKNRGIGWKKTLEKLKKQLNSPMPREKTVKKPVEFIHNPWNIGDVYAYQFHSKWSIEMDFFGKYILLQKTGDGKWYDEWILSKIQVFDKVFDQLPSLSDLDGVRIQVSSITPGMIWNDGFAHLVRIGVNMSMKQMVRYLI
jgi:hypothetical protein